MRPHVIPTASHIEIVRKDGSAAASGELGEIIVTCLSSKAMPLIRYRIGDTGYWGNTCPCGRPLPVIAKITGRISDNFISGDGTLVHGEYFTHMVWHMNSIRKFQVVQHKPDLVQFRLVLAPEGHYERTHEEERLTRETRKALGEGCRITFEYVQSIETGPTGKYRFTLSHVNQS